MMQETILQVGVALWYLGSMGPFWIRKTEISITKKYITYVLYCRYNYKLKLLELKDQSCRAEFLVIRY